MKTFLYVVLLCAALVSTGVRSDVLTIVVVDVPYMVCSKTQYKAATSVLAGNQKSEWSAAETQEFLNVVLRSVDEERMTYIYAPTVMRTARKVIAEMRRNEDSIAKMVGMTMLVQSCTQELRQKLFEAKPPQRF